MAPAKVSELRQQLSAFIARRVNNATDVEDLTQDVFLKMQLNLSELRQEQKIGPWLYKIARNRIIDYYRSNYRKLARENYQSELPEDLPVLETTGLEDEPNQNRELAACLRPMLDKLPEKYGMALKAFEFEDKSGLELAAELGLTHSGAKSRVQRGRELLKKELQACCAFELDRRGNVLDFRERPEYRGQDKKNCGSC